MGRYLTTGRWSAGRMRHWRRAIWQAGTRSSMGLRRRKEHGRSLALPSPHGRNSSQPPRWKRLPLQARQVPQRSHLRRVTERRKTVRAVSPPYSELSSGSWFLCLHSIIWDRRWHQYGACFPTSTYTLFCLTMNTVTIDLVSIDPGEPRSSLS